MVAKKSNGLATFFASAFHEVVVPHLEEIKGDIGQIKQRLDKIDFRLSKIDDRFDRQGVTVDNHKRRIEKLETKSSSITH